MWATSVPILVFLGLSVLELGPMYATERQLSDRQKSDIRRQTASSLNAPPIRGGGIRMHTLHGHYKPLTVIIDVS